MPVSPAAKTMSSGERINAKPLLTKAVENAKLREHNGQSSLRYRMNLLVKEIGATSTYGKRATHNLPVFPGAANGMKAPGFCQYRKPRRS